MTEKHHHRNQNVMKKSRCGYPLAALINLRNTPLKIPSCPRRKWSMRQTISHKSYENWSSGFVDIILQRQSMEAAILFASHMTRSEKY